MCQLVNKCDILFHQTLKDVTVIQKLKSDIDFTKKNFHGKLKSMVLENLSSLVNSVFEKREDEIVKSKAEAIKILQEAIGNKTFSSAGEIASKVSEHVKEHLKHVPILLT